MDKTKRFFRTLLLSILVPALLLAGCASKSESANSVGTVSSMTITDKMETSGNLGADKLAALKWGTSGTVEKVNVTVGQKVKADDILATLRIDSVPSDIAEGQSDLATAQRELQNLLDSDTALAQAQLDVVNARADVETAEKNLTALDYPRASDVLIKNTQAQVEQAQRNVTIAYKKYKDVQHHADGDPIKTQAELNLTNAQLSLNELQATLNWYLGKPTQADYDEAKAELDAARATLADAKRNRDLLKDGIDPLKLSAAEAKVTAAQATVNTMYIIAPFDGEVISVQAVSGNSVDSGDLAIELVDRNTLKIETQVDETSIAAISVGNTAEITMDSLPGETLKGQVSRITRIGEAVNGLIKYTVVISVEPTDKNVLFGATADVSIITSEPYTMLAVPIGAIQTSNSGEYVVRVNTDGSYESIAVQSGDIVGSLVTITGNLNDGDKVVLGTTTTDTTSSSGSGNSGGPGGGMGPMGP
jgi:RND family efflux transporter MFP subunit